MVSLHYYFLNTFSPCLIGDGRNEPLVGTGLSRGRWLGTRFREVSPHIAGSMEEVKMVEESVIQQNSRLASPNDIT